MKIYQILRHDGIGVVESPIETSAVVGEVFKDEKEASDRADELWKKYTTEKERKSGWCPLHFSVKEIEIK